MTTPTDVRGATGERPPPPPPPAGAVARPLFLEHRGQVGDWEVTAPNYSCIYARLFAPLAAGAPARVSVATGPGSAAFESITDPDLLDDAARMLTETAAWLRAQQAEPDPDAGDQLALLDIGGTTP